ncbi:MAG: Histidine kinase, partial [Acidimicrobiaceae bacterium]|nr:Histidine kinase [Acidimicrobiaceae bacterium]
DWCAIDLGDPDGTIRRLAIRHGGDGASARARDAAQAALCSTELSARVPRLADMVARACAGGGSERWSEAAPIDVDSHEGESLGPISCIVTPIRFDEAAFGAISFAVDPRRAGYEGADLAAAEDVARRAGIAVERARLYRTIHASEARWRVLVEAAPVGIVEVDLTGRVCWWNRAASALFGWMDQQLENATSEEQPSFPTEASAQLVDLLSDVSASAEVGGRDLTGVMTGGERRDLTVSAAPLLAADGTVQGILVLVADVTLHRRLETELRQAQRMEVIGQLAGGVAHEFNNLLTLIGGYTELLRRHFEGNERAGALIRDIHAATVRASVLTGQLLTVGRRRALHPVVLAPADEVHSLSEVLERFVPTDVQVSWSLDPASGRVRIDHGQFEQLILNLAINARDAMPDGGRLDIAVAGVELAGFRATELAIPPGKYVRIAVADSGSGMDEETRLRCFEPLYTTKGPSKGTGLGLPAVRRVVLECGGAIRFDSELGSGTTFEVLLPRFDGDDSHDDEVLAAPIRPATIVTPGSGTVLLAEDDDDLRRLVRRVLSHNGYQVLEATSGAEALAIARRHDGRIDVLVSDVLMPGTGGHDLAIQLQDERPGLAVLLVSGSTDATVLSGLGSGPTGFLAKPFKPSDVIASVKELLDERSDPQAAGPSGS